MPVLQGRPLLALRHRLAHPTGGRLHPPRTSRSHQGQHTSFVLLGSPLAALSFFPLSPLSLPPTSLTSSWQGSKENSYCANRGICDPTTGYCTCVTNYQTSNGYAQVGTHPHPLPHHGEHGACQDQIRTRCNRRRTRLFSHNTSIFFFASSLTRTRAVVVRSRGYGATAARRSSPSRSATARSRAPPTACAPARPLTSARYTQSRASLSLSSLSLFSLLPLLSGSPTYVCQVPQTHPHHRHLFAGLRTLLPVSHRVPVLA